MTRVLPQEKPIRTFSFRQIASRVLRITQAEQS